MKFSLCTYYKRQNETIQVTASQYAFITFYGSKEIVLHVIEGIIILMKGSDYIMNLKKNS